MNIYLPIAGQSVNALLIVVLGFLVGVLSGMFGVGGGFLPTPLLIFYGIPPTVAVASATTQITGASVSGVMVHMRRGGVDLKMGGVMIVGGLAGSFVGAALFRLLQSTGQIDIVIGALYVLILAVSAATAMVHALTTRAVDIVLAALLLVGGVIGAQYGALLTLKIKPDMLRLALAVIILLVALRMLLGLAWHPDEIFSIEYL